MEAKELRIGNMTQSGIVGSICYKDGVQGCYLLSNNFDSSGGIFYKMDDIKPIRLSEPRLIEFGFEENNKLFTIKTGWYWNCRQDGRQTSLKIKHTQADNYFVKSPANGSIYVKYNHEVQNLYFVLTGKELKLSSNG